MYLLYLLLLDIILQATEDLKGWLWPSNCQNLASIKGRCGGRWLEAARGHL